MMKVEAITTKVLCDELHCAQPAIVSITGNFQPGVNKLCELHATQTVISLTNAIRNKRPLLRREIGGAPFRTGGLSDCDCSVCVSRRSGIVG